MWTFPFFILIQFSFNYSTLASNAIISSLSADGASQFLLLPEFCVGQFHKFGRGDILFFIVELLYFLDIFHKTIVSAVYVNFKYIC